MSPPEKQSPSAPGDTPEPLIVNFPAPGVMELWLNRPLAGNALNSVLVETLHEAIDHACEVRLLMIRSTGRHFCTGFDLSDLETASDGDLLHRLVRIELLLHKIFAAPFVTLALASGRAMGAGADLFAACDRRIAVGEVTISFPGIGFGLILGTERLTSRIGLDKARDVLRAGKSLDARSALAAGLATELIEAEQIETVVAREQVHASRLDTATVAALHRIGIDDGDRQLAALVRSAARPGLKERIVAYRQASGRKPQ